MSDKYILDGHTPVPVETLEEWSNFFEDNDKRRVALTKLEHCRVSTVFLGINHRWGDDGPPLLFETMVFGGEHDEEMERYSTWDEAIAGHQKMVEKVSNE
jgi:hypothetical protein